MHFAVRYYIFTALGSVCLSSLSKIARLPHLGIWETRKYDESVEIDMLRIDWQLRSASVANTVFLLAMPVDYSPCGLCSCAQVQSNVSIKIINMLAYLRSRYSSGQCRIHIRYSMRAGYVLSELYSKHRFSSFGHALKIRCVDKQGMDLGMRLTLTNKERFHF